MAMGNLPLRAFSDDDNISALVLQHVPFACQLK